MKWSMGTGCPIFLQALEATLNWRFLSVFEDVYYLFWINSWWLLANFSPLYAGTWKRRSVGLIGCFASCCLVVLVWSRQLSCTSCKAHYKAGNSQVNISLQPMYPRHNVRWTRVLRVSSRVALHRVCDSVVNPSETILFRRISWLEFIQGPDKTAPST